MEKVKVKIKAKGLVPQYATSNDSGCDCYALERVYLRPMETKVFSVGIAMELPPDVEVQVRPKSSITAKGVLTHLGTVDNGYRGDIKIGMTNLSNRVVVFNPNQKVAQLVFCKNVVQAEFEKVEEINKETERADGGFGSSGEY